MTIVKKSQVGPKRPKVPSPLMKPEIKPEVVKPKSRFDRLSDDFWPAVEAGSIFIANGYVDISWNKLMTQIFGSEILESLDSIYKFSVFRYKRKQNIFFDLNTLNWLQQFPSAQQKIQDIAKRAIDVVFKESLSREDRSRIISYLISTSNIDDNLLKKIFTNDKFSLNKDDSIKLLKATDVSDQFLSSLVVSADLNPGALLAIILLYEDFIVKFAIKTKGMNNIRYNNDTSKKVLWTFIYQFALTGKFGDLGKLGVLLPLKPSISEDVLKKTLHETINVQEEENIAEKQKFEINRTKKETETTEKYIKRWQDEGLMPNIYGNMILVWKAVKVESGQQRQEVRPFEYFGAGGGASYMLGRWYGYKEGMVGSGPIGPSKAYIPNKGNIGYVIAILAKRTHLKAIPEHHFSGGVFYAEKGLPIGLYQIKNLGGDDFSYVLLAGVDAWSWLEDPPGKPFKSLRDAHESLSGKRQPFASRDELPHLRDWIKGSNED